MSKAKFAAVKELIDEKKYDEARGILRTIDHPTAREWEKKLDTISPPFVYKTDASRSPYIYNVVRVIIVVFIVVLLAVLILRQVQQTQQDIAPSLQTANSALSSAIRSATPNPVGTSTALAIAALISPTLSPTITNTVIPSPTSTFTITSTFTVIPPSATPIKMVFTGNKAKVLDSITFPAGIYRATAAGNENGITVTVTATKGECGAGTSYYSQNLFFAGNGEATFGSTGCVAIIEVKTYTDGDWTLSFEPLSTG